MLGVPPKKTPLHFKFGLSTGGCSSTHARGMLFGLAATCFCRWIHAAVRFPLHPHWPHGSKKEGCMQNGRGGSHGWVLIVCSKVIYVDDTMEVS